MWIVKGYTLWDNGSEFTVELFDDWSNAQKYINNMFVSELDTFEIDKEDKEEILFEFNKWEDFNWEQWEQDFEIMFKKSQSFEINIENSYVSFFELKEIEFNRSLE